MGASVKSFSVSEISVFFSCKVLVFILSLFTSPQEKGEGTSLATVKDFDLGTRTVIRESEEAEKGGDIRTALQGYQRIFDSCQDQVVSLNERVFLNAKEYCRWRILGLSGKGREAYQSLFDATAKDRFLQAAHARDVSRLEEIADRYTFSSYGFPAFELLAQFALEEGDASRALYYFTRMDRYYGEDPLLAERASRSTAGAVCAAALQGNQGELDFWAKRLRESAGVEEVLFKGERIGKKDFLRAMAVLCEERSEREETLRSWHYPQGNGHPLEIPKEKKWKWEISWAHDLFTPLRQRFPDDDPFQTKPLSTPILPLFPAVSGGVLYLFTPGRLSALSCNTGKVLWFLELPLELGVEKEKEGEMLGEKVHEAWSPYFMSLGEGKLFLLNVVEESFHHETHLMAVEMGGKERGKILWKRGGAGDPSPFLRNVLFAGPPIPLCGKVCIGGFEIGKEPEAYLFIFDSGSGNLFKKIFLCSAPSLAPGAIFIDSLDASSQIFFETIPAVEKGMLYFCTNLGAVAAVDVYLGEPLWLFRYERVFSGSGMGRSYRSQLWFLSNVIVHGGKIYCTPCDSPYLHILFPYPERKLGALRNYREEKENGEVEFFYLLGVHEGTVFLAGNELGENQGEIWALKHDAIERKLQWRFRLSEEFHGMGTVASPYLIVPSKKYIYLIDTGKGEAVHRLAPGFRDGERDFGNVISLGRVIVTSSLSQVSSFVLKEDS